MRLPAVGGCARELLVLFGRDRFGLASLVGGGLSRREGTLLDHYRVHQKVVPTLLARMHHQEDQHEQQSENGRVQRSQHQCSEEKPRPADRTAVVETDQLQAHQPHSWTGCAYRKPPPDEQHPSQRQHDGRDLDEKPYFAAD